LRPQLDFKHAFFCGVLGGLAFLTYNGWWLSVAVVSAICVVHNVPSRRKLTNRLLGIAVGLSSLPLLLNAATFICAQPDFLANMHRFSGQAATQGDFSEGWRMPFAYLWHAEHGLIVVWTIGVAAILGLALWKRNLLDRRAAYWAGAVIGIYCVMVLYSVGLHRINLWGRQVRQLIPFLCLATAFAASVLVEREWLKKPALAIVALLLMVQAGLNFVPPLMQRFPRDIEREVAKVYGPVSYETTVKGPKLRAKGLSIQKSQYLLINTRPYLYPVRGTESLPCEKTLLLFQHPMQYLPYQYEGYTPAERDELRTGDISMRLIELDNLKPQTFPRECQNLTSRGIPSKR
jgi:hypothetical protein